MSKLIARISSLVSLRVFFTLIRQPQFWEMCEHRAQRKLDETIQWHESYVGEDWPYNYEPDYYDVIWEAWYAVHNKFGLRYSDKAALYGLLSNYYNK